MRKIFLFLILGLSLALSQPLKVVVFGGLWPMPSILAFFTDANIIYIPRSALNAIENSVVIDLKPEFKTVLSSRSENLEELLSMNADLYLGHSGDKRLYEGLKKAGLNVKLFDVNVDNYNMKKTIKYWLDELSEYFDIKVKNEDLIGKISEAEELIAQRTKGINKLRGLILRPDKHKITVGTRSYYLEKSGLIDAYKGFSTEGLINLEELYRLNPEIIYLTNFTQAQPEDLFNDPKFKDLKAVKNKRVYKFPLATYRPFAPNLDVAPVLLHLAKTNYPELFEDIDIKEEFRKHFKHFYKINLNEAQLELILHPKKEAGEL
ncbi:ABC transporter substrate-binding protein [Campylobacter troglodytis]|uniref:ABC transporter substrate-binding protein n=1 Tax=Campylobacter troglodytis TaxID=654363 RepID=UPI001159CA32|nr:ABC transporter substrate-binding protein [Campylobacter troglodytis]TQR61081.1 hypothetical protein DMC01_02810 [Campylobacter troglodytis]